MSESLRKSSTAEVPFAIREVNQFLVSVIVVILQNREELGGVLDSILKNKTRQVEIIVIDGGSTDGTVELLRELGSQIDYWVSEPDMGIYDAMNKGVAAARGTFIYHINAGDRLIHLPINELSDAEGNGMDVVSFTVSVDDKKFFRPSCGWRLKITNTLHHQGTFYRRTLFPGYNLRFKVFADFDVNQQLFLQEVKFRLYESVVATHSGVGLSSHKQYRREIFRVVASNFGMHYVPIAWIRCRYAGIKLRLVRLISRATSSRLFSISR